MIIIIIIIIYIHITIKGLNATIKKMQMLMSYVLVSKKPGDTSYSTFHWSHKGSIN